MYKQVLEGFEYTSGPTGEAAAVLAHSQKIKAAKQQELCREWHEEVFDKIQDRLQAQLETRGPASISTRLQRNMQEYLHATNTKTSIFRDVIIEQDYNPLAALDSTIKVSTGDLRDPLAKDLAKRAYEESLLTGRRSSSIPRQMSKSSLDIKMWDNLHIHATPYGHCVDKDGNYIVRPMSQGAQRLRASHIPLDHYNVATGREVVDAELPAGKKSVPGPEMRRGRQNLFDVMQNACGQRPDFTGGDLWLEYRGKATPAGPEMRRGRQDLFETFQQRSNAYEPGASMVGDLWLEHKGKRDVPGPDKRRNRPDMATTLRMNSAPPSSRVGDLWLEHKGKGIPDHMPDHVMHEIVTDRVVAPTVVKPPLRPPHRNQISSITPADGFMVGATPTMKI